MRFKRLLSGILGVSVLAASMTVLAAEFPDVKGHWSEEYVNAMVSEGYIKGYDDGTFKPDKTVSNTEALILISRMLGVEKSEYKDTVDNALEAYSSSLTKYNTKYKSEISYLLYREVIDEADLETYISSANKDSALLRYQCAILITKLLGAEDKVTSGVFLSSSYADTAQIPAEARPFVEYVRDAKIMEGMGKDSYGDPIFGPLESVTRGQMAKMLSSLITVLNIYSVDGVISAVDTSAKEITVKNTDYAIEDNTVITVDGGKADFGDLTRGMDVVVFVSQSKVSLIEAYSTDSDDEPLRGVIVSVRTDSNGRTIVISDPDDSSDRSTYEVSEDARIVIQKAVDNFGKLTSGQYIEYKIVDGIVVEIETIEKNATVVGTLYSKDVNSQNPTVTIESSSGERTTYNCSTSGVDVTRNSKTSSIVDLVAGDSVTLKLVYSKVTKITAESQTQSYSGKISSITHSTKGTTLDIVDDGETNEFSVSSSAIILVDGSDGTVYDLRPGSEVTFRADSSMITKLETTQAVSVTKVSGTVTNVQSKYDLLFVNDSGSEVTIVVNSSTNIANGSTGSSMKLGGIKAGDTVEITGSNATGVFVAKVIVVSQ